jgi:hypothetical protein
MKQAIAIFVIITLILSGCDFNSVTGKATQEANNPYKTEIPTAVSKLPLMNLTTVDSFENYKSFADNLNDLISILNQQTDLFKIPLLSTTQESWETISKKITKYGPLINNYNEVVTKAKIWSSNPNDNGIKDFYIASGKFAFETALIICTVFYTTTFKAVGIMYHAVKLDRLAPICGTCVSVILSDVHWFIRTVLVEGASQTAQNILKSIP